ncbi:tetratricopeptide repeat protein [Streptomyces sp. SID1121]|uniref:tetratricopeptide repeat protein n=1 Tax=Streptomyces sp. SID1121 TaxID=3425888 RepID=UPI004057A75F
MAELIRRRQRFVGRRAELGAFRDNLGLAPDDEAHRFLFHVHGIAGVGKTSLVREWEKTARECGALTAYVDEAVTSVPEALGALSAEFARQGHPFKRLDRLLETYRQRRHEAESASFADPGEAGEAGSPGARPSAAGTALATAGTIGLGMIPVVGPFAGVLDTARLAEGADRLRATLSARFRNPDDVRLVLTPDEVLTPVLVEELTEALRQLPWITLFFDTYERTAPFLGGWLHALMTTERYGKLPLPVVVTLAGRQPFDTTLWDGFADFMTDVRLDPFTEDETRGLLAARSVTEETVVAEVLRLSGGLPVLVSTLAQNRPADPDDVGDPSATAVERFLKWERDPLRRRVALECALPRGLDEDVFLAVVEEARAGAGEDAAALYDWLRALPFVTERATAHTTGLRYHDVVRAPMLRLRRTRSPRGWTARHAALARHFAAWREEEETEAGLRADDRWQSVRWRALRLEETYHSLCANPATALAAALRDVAEACRESAGAARRCARALAEAGEDTDDAVVREWGRRLGAALGEDDAGVRAGVGTDVGTGVRAGVGTGVETGVRTGVGTGVGTGVRTGVGTGVGTGVRTGVGTGAGTGVRTGVGTGAGTGAGTGLGTGVRIALGLLLDAGALDPAGRAVAHRVRGRVLSAEGRYEPALADLDRSLALAPGRYEAYLDRAVTHRGLGDTPAALADFHRADELAPDTPEVLRAWGETLRAAGRYEEAVALLDRAIEAAPGDAYATAVRGSALHRLGRHTEALADLDRAVALDGRYLWALVRRGRLHCALAAHDLAVADLDRAAEIAPDSDWIASERGEIHRLAGHYEAADRELTRALTLNPAHPSALAGRGATRHRLHRVTEALADLDGAIALRPDYAWAVEYRARLRAESAAAPSRARHHRQDSV